MTKLIKIASLAGAILFVCFAIFNLVRAIISGEGIIIFALAFLTFFSLCYLGSAIEELKKEE